MADVFISYAREDVERAHALADVLTARGWSVWWDRSIPPGKSFDEVIEEQIQAASSIVVLWSRVSTDSRWVRTEAAEAAERGILVPALIEGDTRIPLAFKRIQAADLSDWTGAPEGHDGLGQLIHAVGSMIGGGTSPGSDPSRTAEPGEDGPRRSAAPAWNSTASHPDSPGFVQALTDALGSALVAAGAIGVIGWFVGTLVKRQVVISSLGVWAVRANIWVFASLCALSVLILFEGATYRPSAVGTYGRTHRRKLRWTAAFSVAAAVAYPLYVILAGTAP